MSGRGAARRAALMEERSMVDWGCCAGGMDGERVRPSWRGFFAGFTTAGRVCGAAGWDEIREVTETRALCQRIAYLECALP
jgi:hypothetical protein